jgi:hypothetical protein
MKKLFAVFLITLSSLSLHAQVQTIKKIIKNMYFNKDTSKRSTFIYVPVLTTAPETGVEVGGSGLFSFYTDTVKKTNVSNIFGYASITTKRQTNLTLNSTYWFPGNSLHLASAISFINFPFDFYGIGNATSNASKVVLGEHRFKLNLEAETKVGDYFLLGLVGGGFYYHFHESDLQSLYYTDPEVQDRFGGPSIFAGPSVIFDSRNNNTYTTSGTIVTAYLNLNKGMFSNSSYEGGFFNIEYSGFFPLAKQWVLGFDIQEQSLVGGQSPFYLLPSLGSDEMMRGYYSGRFRDRNYLAGQTELRYRMTKRFGLDAFAATGEVFHTDFDPHNLKPDWGGGIRYFFDVQKGLTIRMDYGLGEKRPGESRQQGLYIALGEAF